MNYWDQALRYFLCSTPLCWRDLLLQLLLARLCFFLMTSSQSLNAMLLSNIWLSPSLQGPIAPACLFDPPTAPSAPCPPPPPPPPGPPPVFTEDDSQPQAGGVAPQHSALFAQLNQGMDITKGGSREHHCVLYVLKGGDISVNLERFNHTSMTSHSRIKHILGGVFLGTFVNFFD